MILKRWLILATAILFAVSAAAPSAGATTADPLPPIPSNGSAVPTVTPSQLDGCDLFPADSVYHADVRNAPALATSDTELAQFEALVAGDTGVRIPVGAWGGTNRYGVPYNLADSSTHRTRLWLDYPLYMWESGHPIPQGMNTEDGFDQHGVVLETDECRLFEYFLLRYWGFWWGPDFFGWVADGGASQWDLASYDYFERSNGPESATATGLAILPTLLRPAEVRSGRIDHPMSFVVPATKQGAVRWPAQSTDGSSTATGSLTMGSWLRLKADFPETGLCEEAKTIVRALKVHGMILGDTGGNNNAMAMTAEASAEWDATDLSTARSQVEGILSALTDSNSDQIWEIIDAEDFQVNGGSLQVN